MKKKFFRDVIIAIISLCIYILIMAAVLEKEMFIAIIILLGVLIVGIFVYWVIYRFIA